MTPRNDPRIFCGPPLPLDDRTMSQPGVVFTGEEQPRDTQGRYRDTQRPYRGEAMTPEYRQQLFASSPIGRQILKAETSAAAPAAVTAGDTGSKAATNDYKQQSLVYERIWRGILKGEDAAQDRR